MKQLEWLTPESDLKKLSSTIDIASFLEHHLGRFGDKKEDILKAIDYSLNPEKGGFVVVYKEEKEIKAAVVVNKTGMDGYIPAHILVYIAVHESMRGKGIGKEMMQQVMEKAKGGIALHVEPDNPAKRLYERLGFTNKYLEMRYQP
ncbi:MAG: GNAT family N-acetyltransferase [Bacteroidetes bacterium]|nr:GNAT family N-acetyltransferase [Bacteroidota bacterium]NCQ11081.1 GNAT family N-acetyltransferase [Bacteroidota bacterium]